MSHFMRALLLILIMATLPGFSQADVFDKLEAGHDCLKNGNCKDREKLGRAVKMTKKCFKGQVSDNVVNVAGAIEQCNDDINNSLEKNAGKIMAGAEKVVAADKKMKDVDKCLSATDPQEKARCKETAAKDYQVIKDAWRKRRAAKEEKERQEAAPYKWNGRVGGEVRICTRGKDKPLATVREVTNSRVRVEVIRGGGNMFLNYYTGQVVWLEKNQIGC